MCTSNETTTNEEMLQETTIDLSTKSEQELMKIQEAAKSVIDLGLADLTNWADNIVAGTVAYIDDDLLSPAAQTLMKASSNLMHGDKGSQDRLAYILYLDALIASPEAVQASLRAVRDGLVAADPALALVK